jgi:hypothetical protein
MCSPGALDGLAPGYGEEQPVFIVGMPRTGTTLVERILSGHSQVVSIGEFTEFPRQYGLESPEQVLPGMPPGRHPRHRWTSTSRPGQGVLPSRTGAGG